MADKIYRVNMNDLTSTIEDVSEAWAEGLEDVD